MRQITKTAVQFFINNENFSQSNTVVKTDDKETKMYLHGNIIAIKDKATNTIKITNAGWKSNTTKERLNGLPNVSIVQRNFEWYLNGKKWDGKMVEVV